MRNQPQETVLQAEPCIRDATHSDINSIADLYRAVGQAGGGLARTPGEITIAYVSDFVEAARHGGVELGC